MLCKYPFNKCLFKCHIYVMWENKDRDHLKKSMMTSDIGVSWFFSLTTVRMEHEHHVQNIVDSKWAVYCYRPQVPLPHHDMNAACVLTYTIYCLKRLLQDIELRRHLYFLSVCLLLSKEKEAPPGWLCPLSPRWDYTDAFITANRKSLILFCPGQHQLQDGALEILALTIEVFIVFFFNIT